MPNWASQTLFSVAAMSLLGLGAWYAISGRLRGDRPNYRPNSQVTDAAACPFCGGNSLDAVIWDGGTHTVGCNHCDCEGPSAPTPEEAQRLWNQRAYFAGTYSIPTATSCDDVPA